MSRLAWVTTGVHYGLGILLGVPVIRVIVTHPGRTGCRLTIISLTGCLQSRLWVSLRAVLWRSNPMIYGEIASSRKYTGSRNDTEWYVFDFKNTLISLI